MDAREWEQSQSRRSSIKRPWDEDAILPQHSSSWNGAILPPIEAEPYRRPSIQRPIEPPVGVHNRYVLEARESVAKKARYEGHDFRSSSRDDLGLNGDRPQSRLSHSPYPAHRGSQDSSTFPQQHQREGWERQGGDATGGPAGSQDPFNTSNLCPRCRRLTVQQHDLDLLESSEESKSRNPELALVTQAAAAELTKALNTLSSGISSARRGIIRNESFEQQELESADVPPIAQLGLRQALNWLLGRIYLVNELADKLVQHVPPANLQQQLDRHSLRNGTSAQDGFHYSMKRRIDGDLDDTFRPSGDGVEPTSDPKLHTRRKSVAMANIPSSEELPSIRSQSQHEFHPLHSHPSVDGPGPSRRASIMNPPPAPNRQLLSPPGRSLPSPTSLNFPSPSATSYGSSSQSVNHPLPAGMHSSSSNYLPPIGSAHTSDSALQAHSAALQHEVSVQKIALSSLQGEHDKLLAAFSRSQTRASALEKKHAVSDGEIISLSEEKMRLQAQVVELERDVEELSRSRDEFRQAAVQEGAQYVEIVKKASRLEEMAGEERKNWNKLKMEMEQRIDSLSARGGKNEGSTSTGDNTPVPRMIDDIDTPASSVDGPPDVKVEPTSESRSVGPTSNPSTVSFQQNYAKDLKEEIRRLRNRCTEVEDTLRAVRDDSRSVEGIVQALGLAGKSIMDRADRALGNLPE